ncbi:hypothetical protein [Staphylococcus phage SpP]
MSDNQKSIMVVSGYIAGWLISIVQYFIIVGIMVLINYIIPGEANPWLVAMVVMLIWRNNAFVKLAIKNSIQKVEEEK